MAQRTSDDNRPYGYNIIDDVIADVTELYSLVGNGGNSTQKYVAYIKQTGTTAPVIVRVYENSANLTVTPSYSDVGEYSLNISPDIDVANFRASFQQINGSDSKVDFSWNTSESFLGGVVNFIQFFTLSADSVENTADNGYIYSDEILNGVIEITVYN